MFRFICFGLNLVEFCSLCLFSDFFLIGHLKTCPVVNSRNDYVLFSTFFFFFPNFLVRMSSSDFLDLKITFEEDIWESWAPF